MNVDQARNLSKSFWLASRRCSEVRSLPNNKVEMLAVPAIVCTAFSIELGLKYIILDSGGSAHGHKLDELFAQLVTSKQDLVVQNVSVDKPTFLASLTLISNAFSNWRYIYEKSDAELNMAFLEKLANAIQVAIA